MSAANLLRPEHLLEPGKNCWRVEYADRIRFLIDGADYFHAFRETAKKARYSILIVGWDIDSRFELERQPVKDGLPTRLCAFLNTLVSSRKGLHVHVLDWDFSMIYAAGREWLSLYKMDWSTHRRLHFRMDSYHPAGASHHQKIAVIDDKVAFVGGLDFTFGRWDTSEHRPGDARRRDLPESTDPQPYHDVQMMVSGPAAAALGDLVRSRWLKATGHRLSPPPDSGNDPWPDDVAVDLDGAPVGIARTYPGFDKQAEVFEIEQMALDAIASARNIIFIENQYFTARRIFEALLMRLKAADCPEIVLIMPEQTFGWLSQNTMDLVRIRLINQLHAADRYHRFRVYYPYVDGLKICINVHSKVLVIDDVLARVGSANFNNRSMRLDSECDLAIESNGDPRIGAAIAGLRNRLLAEHLDVEPAIVAEALAERHSLIGAIEALSGSPRTLKHFEMRPVSETFDGLVLPDTVYDPELPIDSEQVAREFVTEEDRIPATRSLIALLSLLLVAVALAAIWHWTPLSQWVNIHQVVKDFYSLRGEWLAPVIVTLIYVVASLMVFPITLLIIVTGLTFGAFFGFFYALLGTVVSAMVTYAIGERLGHRTIKHLSNHWVARVSRRLARQGVLAIITLRVVPVAPFTIINLVAGASHIRLRDFIVGTLVGMTPGIIALTVFSDQVLKALAAPEAMRIASLSFMAILIGIAGWHLGRWLIRRQQRAEREQDTGLS